MASLHVEFGVNRTLEIGKIWIRMRMDFLEMSGKGLYQFSMFLNGRYQLAVPIQIVLLPLSYVLFYCLTSSGTAAMLLRGKTLVDRGKLNRAIYGETFPYVHFAQEEFIGGRKVFTTNGMARRTINIEV